MGEAKSADNAKNAEKAPKKSWSKGLKSEFKKIIWPNKASVARQTTAVIIASIFLGAIIKVLDMLIQMGLKFIV